jgi:hypothetical protein
MPAVAVDMPGRSKVINNRLNLALITATWGLRVFLEGPHLFL